MQPKRTQAEPVRVEHLDLVQAVELIAFPNICFHTAHESDGLELNPQT